MEMTSKALHSKILGIRVLPAMIDARKNEKEGLSRTSPSVDSLLPLPSYSSSSPLYPVPA